MATFSKVVAATASYATSPDVVIPFVPKVIRVCCMGTAAMPSVSFDGLTDAAVLLNDVKSPSSVMEWRWQMGQKVWIKASSTVDVQIIAES